MSNDTTKAALADQHPTQPLMTDQHGVIRFKKNALIEHLYEWAQLLGMGLNELALLPFSDEDRQQFAQLIGYSLSGYGSLSYVDDAAYERAAAPSAPLVAEAVQCQHRFAHFGDQQPERRCIDCNAIESGTAQPSAQQPVQGDGDAVWVRDQRGDFEGPQVFDPLVLIGGADPKTGLHGATYTRFVPALALPPAQPDDDDDDDDDAKWRDVALRFDTHRMQALWHLQAMLKDPAKHADIVRQFLKDPTHPGAQPAPQAQGVEELRKQLEEERETTRNLSAALREATECPTFMGEPVATQRSSLTKRCYLMSESHLSGYRLVIGFERQEDVNEAHAFIARLPRDTTPPSPVAQPEALPVQGDEGECRAEPSDWAPPDDHDADGSVAGMAARASLPTSGAPVDAEQLRRALKFYADGEHFSLADESAWDTVSGEPQNWWCDEAGTATIEDGSLAKFTLAGVHIDWDADDGPVVHEEAAHGIASPQEDGGTAA